MISLGDGVSRFELKEKEIELVLLKHNQLRRQEAYEMGAKDMIQTVRKALVIFTILGQVMFKFKVIVEVTV